MPPAGAKKGMGKRKAPVAPVVNPAAHWLQRNEDERLLLDGKNGAIGICNYGNGVKLAAVQEDVAARRVSDALQDAHLAVSLQGLRLQHLPDQLVLSTSWVQDLDCSLNALHSAALVEGAPLRHLPSLRRLDLHGNALGPSGAFLSSFDCPNLVELNLEENILHDIPESLAALTRLEWVSLRRNMLLRLPSTCLQSWGALQVLDLRENKLEELPDSIGSCTQLKQLLLGSNYLTSLPHTLLSGCAASLEVLQCQSNKLTALPSDLATCTALRELNAASNAIAAIPAGVLCGLTALQSLILSGNKLSQLPDDLCTTCPALEVLFVGGNALTSIPDNIGALVHLRELGCDGNPGLTSLPSGLVGCVKLTHATFRGTKIKALPNEEAASSAWTSLRLLDFRTLGKGKQLFKATTEFVVALPRECRVLGAGVARSKKKKAAAKKKVV